MKYVKYVMFALAVLGLGVSSVHAQAIDLSQVVSGITDVKDAVIGVAPTVIAAAFAVFAIKWGVGFVISLFNKASKKG